MDKNFKYSFELFNNFPDMYFCLSEKGEIEKMNSVAENILQGTKDLEHYSEIFDLIELCDRNEAQKIFKETLEQKKVGRYKTRFFINRKLIDVSLTFIIPFPAVDENSPAVIAAARDITEEIQKEDDLLRFHNIAEGSVNPVLITDITGKMIYVASRPLLPVQSEPNPFQKCNGQVR